MENLDASPRNLLARVRAVFDRYAYAVLTVSGLLSGITVMFPQIGLLEWVVLIPAFAVLLRQATNPTVRFRRMYLMGLAFFLPYLLLTFHWFFYMYPLDFADMSRPASAVVVTAACVGLSAFQAVGEDISFPRGGDISAYYGSAYFANVP